MLSVAATVEAWLRETRTLEAWLVRIQTFYRHHLWLLVRLMMENQLWFIRRDQHHGGIVFGAMESISSESTLRS